MRRLTLCLLITMLLMCAPRVWAQIVTIDFDNPQPPGGSYALLQGEFQGINWGSGQWRWEGPFNVNSTNHIFFDSGAGTTRTFVFSPGPRILESLSVFTFSQGTLTLSDDLEQGLTQLITPGSVQTVTTGWTQGSTTVTVAFTAGWDMGLDDIIHRASGPPPQQFTLAVTQAGDGQGTVTSVPAGLSCGVSCTAAYAENTAVALTASPSGGSVFDGWGGDPDCVDGTVTMTAEVNCTATFSIFTGGDGGTALQFFGNGVGAPDQDRVKIQVDDFTTASDPPFPVDVGNEDFTIEFWMNALAGDNTAPPVTCGQNQVWVNGNIVLDRDRFNQDRKFGLSIAGGTLVFGVSGDGTGDRTICGTTNVLDGIWHHVVIQRRMVDGFIQLFVDGALDAQTDGPDGDISYPDDGVPGNFCNGPCVASDPYLVIGAEKHDAGAQFPSYAGLIDEMRISNVLRYEAPFVRPSAPFVRDASTVALYHFDEGAGKVVRDDLHPPDGPRDGVVSFGGTPAGPLWVLSDAPLVAP